MSCQRALRDGIGADHIFCRFFDYRLPDVVAQIRAALGGQRFNKVLDTVSMPYTLGPISQLVSSGAKLAAVLPVNTPMPEGVEVKPVMFGRCNDVSIVSILVVSNANHIHWVLVYRKGYSIP